MRAPAGPVRRIGQCVLGGSQPERRRGCHTVQRFRQPVRRFTPPGGACRASASSTTRGLRFSILPNLHRPRCVQLSSLMQSAPNLPPQHHNRHLPSRNYLDHHLRNQRERLHKECIDPCDTEQMCSCAHSPSCSSPLQIPLPLSLGKPFRNRGPNGHNHSRCDRNYGDNSRSNRSRVNDLL